MIASFRGLCLLVVGASAGAARALPAQSAHGLDPERAALGISADDLRMRIGIIADDSMGGRNTPSPGLEKTARYVADQFMSFGLEPGLGNTYLQRYPLTVVLPGPAAGQGAVLRGPDGEVRLAGEGVFARAEIGMNEGSGPVVRIASTDEMGLAAGRVALLRLDRSGLRQIFRSLRPSVEAERPAAVIIALALDDEDDGLFDRLAGFLGGLFWVDHRSRKRHGGIRLY